MITSVTSREIAKHTDLIVSGNMLVAGIQLASVEGVSENGIMLMAHITKDMEDVKWLRDVLSWMVRDIDAWLLSHASKN